MEITPVPKSLTDISIMWRERSQAHINKAEDNDRLRADYFWLRLEKKQHLTCGLEVGGRGGGGAAMASEPTCQRGQTIPWQRRSAATG